jgi:hypothetical protein
VNVTFSNIHTCADSSANRTSVTSYDNPSPGVLAVVIRASARIVGQDISIELERPPRRILAAAHRISDAALRNDDLNL